LLEEAQGGDPAAVEAYGGYFGTTIYQASDVGMNYNPETGAYTPNGLNYNTNYSTSQVTNLVRDMLDAIGAISYNHQEDDANEIQIPDLGTPDLQPANNNDTQLNVEDQESGDTRILLPVSPSTFNLVRIGDAYYTNLTYEENFYDFRLDLFHFGVLSVNMPSINLMVSARNTRGQFISAEEAKTGLSFALHNARWDVLNKYLDSNDQLDSADAGELLVTSLNEWIKVWFSYGIAAERSPQPWAGVGKSTYINLWP